jgi:V/A-type H+-transporting ATPase subunit I
MSITELCKVTLYGTATDRPKVLNELQGLGCMHLIPLQEQKESLVPMPLEQADAARQALRYLLNAPHRRHQVLDAATFDLERAIAAVLDNKQKRREAEDRRLFLSGRIRELTPWGNFTLPTLAELGGNRLWFYQVPHKLMPQFQAAELPWQRVAQDNRFFYVVAIAEEEPPKDALPVPRVHTGSVPLNELKQQLQQVELEIEDLQAEHDSLSRWIYLLSKNLAEIDDRQALADASQQTRQEDGIFLVQGWAPRKELRRLDRFAQQYGLALLAESPSPKDKPPTLMENPPGFQGGQDLVSFYQIPGYWAWDPSGVLSFSFALFFAMILADAAYAIVLGVLLAYFWKKLGQSAGGRGFRRLAVGILVAAFIYGILVGSFFGIEPPEGSWLARLHVLNVNDFNTMMRLSLTIGCLHLTYANAMAAYHATSTSGRIKPFGWIAIILGGLSLLLAGGSSLLSNLGIGLLVGGVLLIILFGSDRKVNSLKSATFRLLGGLGALFDITKLFGDTLSYLRLFALGLASASLAITFNQIAGQLREAIPGFGFFIALLVLLFGHALNLLLGIISGFVHGLRLNYIEFFNWSISEEGYPFKAFAKKELRS